MVTSLLVVGLDTDVLDGIDAEVGVVGGAEEAIASLTQRAWDVVAVGADSGASCESLVTHLARRYPTIPLVLVSEGSSPGSCDGVWEVVAPRSGEFARALRRAAEVSRLRREVSRLKAERDDRLPRAEVAQAFERGSIREMERLMIMERLNRMNQNRTHSAASLDISVRTLRNKLREYRDAGKLPAPAGEPR